jgi:hypothetical protein
MSKPRPFARLKVVMFPKHIGSSEKIDCVALSRSRLGASTRGFELVAHRSTDRIDKI